MKSKKLLLLIALMTSTGPVNSARATEGFQYDPTVNFFEKSLDPDGIHTTIRLCSELNRVTRCSPVPNAAHLSMAELLTIQRRILNAEAHCKQNEILSDAANLSLMLFSRGPLYTVATTLFTGLPDARLHQLCKTALDKLDDADLVMVWATTAAHSKAYPGDSTDPQGLQVDAGIISTYASVGAE